MQNHEAELARLPSPSGVRCWRIGQYQRVDVVAADDPRAVAALQRKCGGPPIDVTQYWETPPPERSSNCMEWMEKIASGWRPNKRIRQMGYHEAANFFGVYIWEFANVLLPAMKGPL